MENKKIIFPELFFTDKNLVGRDVCKISRNLSDLKGIFADVEAFETSLPTKSVVCYPKRKGLREDCISVLLICIREKSAMSI